MSAPVTPPRAVLAVDTSTLHESVAVVVAGEVRAERLVHHSRGHGPGVLDDIHGCLEAAQLTLADVDALVAGLGPGSFTGLRIALATLKGLALATGKPLYGARTTQALIAALPGARVLALIDARRSEVYADGADLAAPWVGAPDALVARLPAGPPLVCLGSGARVYAARIRAARPDVIIPTDPALHVPRAAHLLTAVDWARVPPLGTLEPVYVRKSDAEINYPDGFPDVMGGLSNG
ncbi:MAG: tRNA (adenosine(37)-N6)-threonylcarbamoyltransferase complex dimerization subunit type 1 TsaB [Myxococcales bacterium]|nr:tRNA (adenosine(37)-N6)-threonylcarbamoyltransferase complex dimerization subunit type 1 TsaB [Myxococcales bacterium]MCB9526016.1 tRNA (adenosine(37)-N6)-threonylcarbamoyltransferase complex dimerization subunit type 1 TsaB [Myxococcales bacterium]